jgi:hypothetical protein
VTTVGDKAKQQSRSSRVRQGVIERLVCNALFFMGEAGLLDKFAFNEAGDTRIRQPKVTYKQIFEMIEDIQNHEAWTKEMEGQSLRQSLQILDGGLSK